METSKSASVPQVLPYAWVILWVAYFASVAAPLNQFKVPPIIPVLLETFGITLSQAGALMSIIAVIGLVLALPAGVILQRFGLRITGIAALLALAVGSAAGALASSFTGLMIGRVIEGLGVGLISVVAPAAIAMWFPPERQGTPMGIWATWVPIGTVAVYWLAPAMTAQSGWQSVWWLGAAFALLMLVVYALLMRMPPAPAAAGASPAAAIASPAAASASPAAAIADGEAPDIPGSTIPVTRTAAAGGSLLSALWNRDIWLIALAFACFNLVFVTFGTYYPSFLADVRSYPLSQAAFIASIGTAIVIGSAPLAGWLSDRIGSRRLVMSIPFLLIGAAMLFPFRVTGGQIIALMIFQGIIAGAVPTAAFAAAPEVMRRPEWAGLGLAVVLVGQNLGQLIGPLVFGGIITGLGWANAGYLMIPFCLLGFIAAWLVRVR